MPVTRETKTGTVDSFYDNDSGRIIEDGSNEPREFFQPGARVEFVTGDKVTYLKVTLPTGGVVLNEIRKGGGS